jgi:hypothetical protein
VHVTVVASVVTALRSGGVGTWTVQDLSRLVGGVAADPVLWAHEVLHRDGSRWYTRLYVDADVECWLMTWARDTTTEMHDHGGSVGAYRVVEGVLTEDWVSGRRVRRRAFSSGRTLAFGADRIHDVANHDEGHAVSLHAYSPPLRRMTYYVADTDGVRAVRTADVSDRVPA